MPSRGRVLQGTQQALMKLLVTAPRATPGGRASLGNQTLGCGPPSRHRPGLCAGMVRDITIETAPGSPAGNGKSSSACLWGWLGIK